MACLYKRKRSGRYWIAYYVNGKERRESALTNDHGEAVKKLLSRQNEVKDGNYVGPNEDRVTVRDLLDQLIVNYETHERVSLDTVRAHVRLWKQEVGPWYTSNVRAVSSVG